MRQVLDAVRPKSSLLCPTLRTPCYAFTHDRLMPLSPFSSCHLWNLDREQVCPAHGHRCILARALLRLSKQLGTQVLCISTTSQHFN